MVMPPILGEYTSMLFQVQQGSTVVPSSAELHFDGIGGRNNTVDQSQTRFMSFQVVGCSTFYALGNFNVIAERHPGTKFIFCHQDFSLKYQICFMRLLYFCNFPWICVRAHCRQLILMNESFLSHTFAIEQGCFHQDRFLIHNSSWNIMITTYTSHRIYHPSIFQETNNLVY